MQEDLFEKILSTQVLYNQLKLIDHQVCVCIWLYPMYIMCIQLRVECGRMGWYSHQTIQFSRRFVRSFLYCVSWVDLKLITQKLVLEYNW